MKTTLTIEESQRLIELGVDPKMASLKKFVNIHPEVLKGNAEYAKPWGWFPKFRLEDIMSILPKEIEIEGEKEDLNIVMDNFGALVGYPKFHEKHGCAFVNPELIDALYSLLIWCQENKIIKLKED
ncbi:MAG: hypothetical protein HDR48_03630 [Bacteroides sp.]|nr:hypothetical protein [Bacteroides sp.]